MSFKSYMVHYKNKYHGIETCTENSLDVYNQSGKHVIALRKNGAGQIQDMSKELGCEDEHDLEPIEKKFRAYKLYANGHIAKAEEFSERFPEADKAIAEEGKIHGEKAWIKISADREVAAAEKAKAEKAEKDKEDANKAKQDKAIADALAVQAANNPPS